MKAYRHGDVVIRELSPHEYGSLKRYEGPKATLWRSDKHLTLAEGEITGHSHVLTANEGDIAWKSRTDYNWQIRDLEFMPKLNFKVLSLDEQMSLTHEEHAEIKLPKGNYIVYQQREQWVKETERAVWD